MPTKAELEARVAELESDLAGHRGHAVWLNEERQRIMDRAQRRFARREQREEWVVATAFHLGDHRGYGVMHVRDPAAPPHLAEPTTVRGRYLHGGVREAGPGSHIGLALCGYPLMADQLWVTAAHLLKGPSPHADLCGMCSYLSGQPTIDAAREALRAQ